MPIGSPRRASARSASIAASLAFAGVLGLAAAAHATPPKVVLISLDGATLPLIEEFMRDGTIPHDRGLGLLKRKGLVAERNVTVNPSLTAPGHIAIATGSTAARNDVPANTFHLLASPFAMTISGFGAPIGGYTLTNHGPEESDSPTAEPLWLALRDARKRVATATWPGGDGVDVTVPGVPGVRSCSRRRSGRSTTRCRSARSAASSAPPASRSTAADFQRGAGERPSPSSLRPEKFPSARCGRRRRRSRRFTVGGVPFTIRVAALDTTNDGTVNYDTLVFFDQTQGIQPGPFVAAVDRTGIRESGRGEVRRCSISKAAATRRAPRSTSAS